MDPLEHAPTEPLAPSAFESLRLYPEPADQHSQSATQEVSSFDITRRPDPTWDSAEVAEVLSQLRRISLAPAALPEATDVDFAVKEVLGEGGMGVVTLCHQRSLKRDVAVKTLRAQNPSPIALRALLQEARITGALEHPSIVPVYDLGILPDGRPLLVMKRVTGVVWRTLLRDPNHPAWERVAGDRLAFHLEVLRKVCDAVHFAHSRGVVHRDLKTGNVMLGEFGEVYVLDWGIACEIADPDGAAQWIGTPGFMAPELLSGGAEPATARTDVYLLGGMLHEVLTGTSRHLGKTLQEVLLSALRSEPVEYPPGVPSELAALCNAATRADASERTADARAFSDALAAYAAHSASKQLATAAHERLVELRSLTPGTENRHARRLWTEAQVGLQRALSSWPATPGAREDLEEATRWMTRHELARRDLDAAEALLRSLQNPPQELAAEHIRLRAALTRDAQEMATLRGMARELDPFVASRERALAALVGAAGAAALPLGMHVLARRGQLAISHPSLAAALGGVLLFAAAVAWRWRAALLVNRAARRMAAVPFVALLSALASLGLGAWLALSAHVSAVMALGALAAVFAATGVALDPRLFVLAAIMLAAALAGAAWPAHLLEIVAIAGMCASGAIALRFYAASAREPPSQEPPSR